VTEVEFRRFSWRNAIFYVFSKRIIASGPTKLSYGVACGHHPFSRLCSITTMPLKTSTHALEWYKRTKPTNKQQRNYTTHHLEWRTNYLRSTWHTNERSKADYTVIRLYGLSKEESGHCFIGWVLCFYVSMCFHF
jgi:hypothetical protein